MTLILNHRTLIRLQRYNKGKVFKYKSINDYAQFGHLSLIKMDIGLNIHFTFMAMNFASKYGYLNIVKWLHHNTNRGCTEYAMDYASRNGHLDVVIWLHQNRKEGCSKNAMNWASMHGHLNIIKWLHNNRNEGCNVWAMDLAVCYNHLHVVKWLHNNRNEGCSKRTIAIANASRRGFTNIVSFLKQNYPQYYQYD